MPTPLSFWECHYTSPGEAQQFKPDFLLKQFLKGFEPTLKLTLFQIAQRCRATSADAQQHKYERTFTQQGKNHSYRLPISKS